MLLSGINMMTKRIVRGPWAVLLPQISRRSLTMAANFVDLAYDVVPSTENNKKPPIVILHGVFGSKQNWRTISKELRDATGRKVIVTDARNHGSSPHASNIDYECMVEDLMRLLDKLKLNSVCLLGHSMGGKTAMLTALKYQWRVKELIVVDIAPKATLGGGDTKTYLNAMVDMDLKQVKNRKDANLFLAEAAKSKSVRDFLLTNLVYSRKTKTYNWRINLGAIYKNFHKLMDFPEVKTQFSGRTVWICGMNSNHVENEDYKKIFQLFPDLQGHNIRNAGHWVHSDQPKQFVQVVDEFLSRRYLDKIFEILKKENS